MARVDNGSLNVNLRGVEASNIFLEPVFIDNDTMALFTVIPDVPANSSRKMMFVSEIVDPIRQKIGCGFNPVDGASVYDRCVSTTLCAVDLQMCYDEFMQTAMVETMRKGGDIVNLEGTLIADIVLRRLRTAVEKQFSQADPAYNFVDGLWTVYIPQLVTQGLMPNISGYSGAPLAAGDAIDMLTDMYNGAANELKATANNDKVFIVASEVWEQLLIDARSGLFGSTLFVQALEGMAMRMVFQGVEIVPMYDWQGLAATHLGVNNANLALYTAKQNMVYATDMIGAQTMFKVWNDEDDELLKIKARFSMGFNYVHPSLMISAGAVAV
jgi:hypothetical protein